VDDRFIARHGFGFSIREYTPGCLSCVASDK
jgi:hypothetical protein